MYRNFRNHKMLQNFYRKINLKLILRLILALDTWFRWGYYGFFGKFYAAKFELAPLAMVHAILISHDASRVCPRRKDWQMQCMDQKCHDCAHHHLNIADCGIRLTCGILARLMANILPMKSGHRKRLMTTGYGNVPFDSIDLEQLAEQDFGMIRLNLLLLKTFQRLTRN